MNKNSFMTKFLVLLLLAGVATLAAPRAVQAQAVTISDINIYVSKGPSAASTDIVDTSGNLVSGLTALTSATASTTTLGIGSVIGIAVTFSGNIEATNANGARLRLRIGTVTSKYAVGPLRADSNSQTVYTYGTGATADHLASRIDNVEWRTLVYTYTVASGDTGTFGFVNVLNPLAPASGSAGVIGADGTTATDVGTLTIPSGVTLHWPSAETIRPTLSTPAAGDYPIQYVNSSGTPLDAAPRPGGTGAPSRYHHVRQEHLDLQGRGIGGAEYTAQAALVNADGWSKPELTNSRKASYWREGDVISIRLKFSEPVKVDTTNKPTLMLGGEGVQGDEATLTDADATDGDNLLTFHYTVGAHDDNFGGITLWSNFRHNTHDTSISVWADQPLLANPKYITDLAGNPLDMNVDLETPLRAYLGNDPDLTSWRDDHEGASFTLKPDGFKETTIQYLVDPIRPNVYIPGVIKNGVTHTDDKSNEHITLATLRAAADVMESAAQTGAFDVEFRFSNVDAQSSLSSIAEEIGESFEGDDVKITGDDVIASEWGVEVSYIGLDHRETDTSGRIWNSASFLVYKATITPPVDYDGDVTLTVPENKVQDIAGNGNRESNALTVPIISLASTLGVPTKGTRTLPSVRLPAKGFVVLAHSGASVSNTGLAKTFHPIAHLPNLENLFGPNGNGGTLELVDKRAVGTTSKILGPIITEIMWGSDLSQADPKLSQWLEIYNAGAAIADLSDYALKITPALSGTFSADDNAVDTVGNLGNGKWAVPGQGGRTVALAATEDTAGADVVPLISMRRKVDFSKAANDVNNGTLSGSWEASTTPALNIASNRIATPGAKPATQITQAQRTPIPYGPVIINEIGHSDNPDNIWIELRNVSTGEANLKNWQLSIIDADRKEHPVMHFPNNKGDYKLGAGKVLLLVNKDPLNTPLARGKKFGDSEKGMTAAADQEKSGLQTDAMFYDAKGTIVLPHAGLSTLPGNGKFLLVLRSEPKTNHEKIVDISGELFLPDEGLKTSIWPLIATPAGNGNAINGDLAKGRVYKRNKAGEGFGEKVWDYANYTGLGYDRSADNTPANGGTPGFPNDALKEKPGDLAGGAVTISEIMVVSDNGRYPQWIELRNSSATRGVKLDAWHLKIKNVGTDVDSRQNVTINLPNGYIIGPNQTILIATRRGSAPQPLNSQRVMLLWTDSGGARQALEVDNSRFSMLSMKGFTLELFGKDVALSGTPTDTVTIGAELLTEANIGNPEQRISLIRYYDSRIATDNWVSAKGSEQLIRIPSDTYYGIADDVGTPGYYPGTALPVSLSSFLPKRTDAGVVIKWVTQSELNNAGFNILRSATKTGAFVVINPTMIQGAGTTGEKQTYSYTDKTAKPNIVYYYQIEDVSFDGNRQRLTGATRLRGHIGAAGKLTTTWGNLKVQE